MQQRQRRPAIGREALTTAGDAYRSGFAVAMLITAGLVLVVGLVGSVLVARHEDAPAS